MTTFLSIKSFKIILICVCLLDSFLGKPAFAVRRAATNEPVRRSPRVIQAIFRHENRTDPKILDKMIEELNSDSLSRLSRDDLYSSIDLAFLRGDLNTLKEMASLGIDFKSVYFGKITPLCRAVDLNNLAIVKFLLDKKVDPNQIKEDGSTALMSASAIGNMEILKVLIEAGANPNFQTIERRNTPLLQAVWHGKVDIAISLLEAGANPHHKSKGGKTAFMWATELGNAEMVDALHNIAAD